MHIDDYLLAETDQNWGELLQAWFWILPENFGVWMVNKLGDLIFVFDDESVHFLDIGPGTLTKIADSQDDFLEKLNEDNNADLWLGLSLIDDCTEAGMTLKENQCFGYKTSPALGGEYAVENFEPTDLAVHYGIHGQIHEQIKDLPEGSTVDIHIEPPQA